jgi:DNA-directed RNA polymerase specialized sigma subunit
MERESEQIGGFERVKAPDVPDKYELAARMKFVEEKSWAQIGRELGLSSSSLSRLKQRIQKDIKKALCVILISRK